MQLWYAQYLGCGKVRRIDFLQKIMSMFLQTVGLLVN